ncbi:TrkH family potassium uptake protein [Meiothermus sp. PNK-Is4]|nr:TrkH family potassium uptake protein [Meiothermus sp. Pnk-1]RYM33681.1 TrkH family potassium uptake protein [Meiothermus sp. PNK-Is4]
MALRSQPRPTGWPFPVATYITGIVFIGLGVVMILLGILDALYREDATGFLGGGLLGVTLGWLLRRLGSAHTDPRRAEALFTVALLWILVPALGAIPFWISGNLAPLDALFESVSGFTTTGATVLTDFSRWGYGLFLWRSLIQWFGGIGILLIFIVVLPQLAVAGRQLFFTEITGVQKEKITPKLRQTAAMILRIYVVLTLVCFGVYMATGQPFFEALCNALSTVPAGGLSPSAKSFAAYSPVSQWAGTLFMFLAGIGFLLQYRLFFGREVQTLLRDAEFRAYMAIIGVSGVTLAGYFFFSGSYGLEPALRHAFFQVTSIVTTTGFASTDFGQWALPAQMLLIILMFVGGTSGSAAGGIKVIRWLIAWALVKRELQRSLHPQAVLPLRVGNKVVSEEVLRSVAAFITLYILLFAVGMGVIGITENNFFYGFTASAAFIGNTGPAYGEFGPFGHYGNLHPASKVVAIVQMWAGRIELIPLMILLFPTFWRRLRG